MAAMMPPGFPTLSHVKHKSRQIRPQREDHGEGEHARQDRILTALVLPLTLPLPETWRRPTLGSHAPYP